MDGDGPPILESGAIVQYLQLKYGGGRLAVPPSDARFGEYLQWLWAGEATLMPCIDRYWAQWFSVPEDKRDEKVLLTSLPWDASSDIAPLSSASALAAAMMYTIH